MTTTNITARQKTDSVLRLFRGEPAEVIANELNVSVQRVEAWKYRFVSAGYDELARRKDAHVQPIRTRWRLLGERVLLASAFVLSVWGLVRMLD